ncbi:MAG TPA: hypothetical protein VE999_02245 [Gemmataceae bacterium]|nr:hypothetical protein [Gemmataceae bacterium]
MKKEDIFLVPKLCLGTRSRGTWEQKATFLVYFSIRAIRVILGSSPSFLGVLGALAVH